ncbi:MAG: hypothetical protein COB02_18135 [Candidatus Cloacimonadota bacterium]|nr:MAG: hypothetical protein COB02_18135 [Candidatus Cloacimonadota bacterium]
MKNIILKSIVALGISITLTNAQSYQARGVGSIGQHYNLHPTQKMLMARESAIIDAQRRLMEFVVGAKIKSDSTRKNTSLLKEEVRSQSEGLVRRARIVSERQIGNQAYEVVMAIVDETQNKITPNLSIVSNNQHKNMLKRETPIVHDYVNTSLNISPNVAVITPKATKISRVQQKRNIQTSLINNQAKTTTNQELKLQEQALKQELVKLQNSPTQKEIVSINKDLLNNTINTKQIISEIIVETEEVEPTWTFKTDQKQNSKSKREIELNIINSIQEKILKSVKRQNAMKKQLNKLSK